MEKLDKAYEAVDLLKSIDIPISPEQKAIISRLEKDYVREEIIPLFEQELQSMVGKMRNKFELEVTYSKENGVDISLVDRPKIQPQIFASEQPAKRQRKYIIRVLFPDNHVSCNKTVWETLMDVIRYAGPSRVQQLGITIMGGISSQTSCMRMKGIGLGRKKLNQAYMSVPIHQQTQSMTK